MGRGGAEGKKRVGFASTAGQSFFFYLFLHIKFLILFVEFGLQDLLNVLICPIDFPEPTQVCWAYSVCAFDVSEDVWQASTGNKMQILLPF